MASRGWSDGGADTGAGVAALQRTTLVLAQSTPHAVVLTGLKSPLKTLLPDVATPADLLGFLDLEDGRTGVSDGEEQFRVFIETSRTVAPIHGWVDPLSDVGWARPWWFETLRVGTWRGCVNVFTCVLVSRVPRNERRDNP